MKELEEFKAKIRNAYYSSYQRGVYDGLRSVKNTIQLFEDELSVQNVLILLDMWAKSAKEALDEAERIEKEVTL